MESLTWWIHSLSLSLGLLTLNSISLDYTFRCYSKNSAIFVVVKSIHYFVFASDPQCEIRLWNVELIDAKIWFFVRAFVNEARNIFVNNLHYSIEIRVAFSLRIFHKFTYLNRWKNVEWHETIENFKCDNLLDLMSEWNIIQIISGFATKWNSHKFCLMILTMFCIQN